MILPDNIPPSLICPRCEDLMLPRPTTLKKAICRFKCECGYTFLMTPQYQAGASLPEWPAGRKVQNQKVGISEQDVEEHKAVMAQVHRYRLAEMFTVGPRLLARELAGTSEDRLRGHVSDEALGVLEDENLEEALDELAGFAVE